jgi:uncharacterized cupredoxin-like copper-binding protein
MHLSHSALHLAAACTIVAALTAPAFADEGAIVGVTLWDKGTSAPMSNDEGMGMTNASMSGTNMGIKTDKDMVKAGEVKFEVTNSSQETEHEMIILPIPEDGNLPYDEKEARFDEDKAGALGEVSELAPGKSGEVTLHLKPGKYVLSCNVANHFANGMWTTLLVQ